MISSVLHSFFLSVLLISFVPFFLYSFISLLASFEIILQHFTVKKNSLQPNNIFCNISINNHNQQGSSKPYFAGNGFTEVQLSIFS